MESRILETITHSNEQDVLATIIHVEGSAYQKEGTCMLFRHDGKQIGLLSGGCLEEDLATRAKEALRSRKTDLFVYDLKQEDDLSWGQGTGCNGIIHVLLQPITETFRNYLLTVKSYLDRGEHVLFARKLTDEKEEEKNLLFLTESGHIFGGFDEDIPKEIYHLSQTTPPFQTRSGIKTISNIPFYIHHYWPKPRLVIFGANPDAKPLASFAKQLGFCVTVTDWRPAFCHAEHFPDADEWILGFPNEVIPTLALNERDFVVVMTHHFQRDQEILSLLLHQPLYYLGVLGPKKRTARLLSTDQVPPYVYSPIGLRIGARGPEEIAISVLAEMIHVLRNGRTKKVVFP